MDELKRFRTLCNAQLQELTIPDPFDIHAFAASIAELRGRPLQILPMPIPAGETCPFGLWVETNDVDFVLHEADTSPMHRDQIVLHELCHMLLGHHSGTLMDGITLTEALPDLDPAMVLRMLARHAYDNDQETQAETMASVILERVCRRPTGHNRGLLGRLGQALQHPRQRS